MWICVASILYWHYSFFHCNSVSKTVWRFRYTTLPSLANTHAGVESERMLRRFFSDGVRLKKSSRNVSRSLELNKNGSDI